MTNEIPTCAVCLSRGADIMTEQTPVRSNVRKFQDERFVVWRCKHCGSIHARDEVDLAHYYAHYPFHALPMDWRMRLMYENQLSRLRKAGLRKEHRILDYGCGGGDFIRFLKEKGYESAFGYDEYSEAFSDVSLLESTFDCVFSQDLIEHVASPRDLVDKFDALARPGGIIAVGTPNATAIDLSHPDSFRHTLHEPYHRHIYSKSSLLSLGKDKAWELTAYYPTQYANTPFPFLNSAFYLYYMTLFDDTLDVLVEPPKLLPLILRFPLTLFWGFFGYFFARETDVMVMFRRG